MPFFYVPGNHDITNTRHGQALEGEVRPALLPLRLPRRAVPDAQLRGPAGHSGRSDLGGAGRVRQEDAGRQPRRAAGRLVFLHKPIWACGNLEKNGWLDVEKAPRRPAVHRLRRPRPPLPEVRPQRRQNYYQLATTGGGSKLRGVEYGEFDHIVWVTMKKDGPVLANILLDGILPEDLQAIETAEEAAKVLTAGRPTRCAGRCLFEGKPVPRLTSSSRALGAENLRSRGPTPSPRRTGRSP